MTRRTLGFSLLMGLLLGAPSTHAAFRVTESSLQDIEGELIAGTAIDIDGDGDLDFLGVVFAEEAYNENRPSSVIALRNDDGSFRPVKKLVRKIKTVGGVGSANVAAADFNGDGIMDVFIGEGGRDSTPFPGARNSLALGSKKGKLVDQSKKLYPDRPEFTHGIGVGDATGNGRPDIFEANVGCGGPTCLPLPPGAALFVNDGSGKFSVGDGRLPASIEDDTELVGGEYQSAAFLDADKDGDADLVLGWGGGDGRRFTMGPPDNGDTEILLVNDGTGFFDWAPAGSMPERRIGTDASTHHMVVGDIDGDGWLDLALNLSPLDPGVPLGLQVLLNNRNGTFRDGSGGLPEDVAPDHLRMADINGDGFPDLLGTEDESPMILLNNGKARFRKAKAPFEQGNSVAPLLDAEATAYPADYDADGDMDVLFLAGGRRVFYAGNVSPLQPAKKLKKPGKPKLRGPRGANPFSESALLEWKHKKRAVSYDIQVATDSDFDSIVFDRSGWTGNSLEVFGLDSGTAYFWRVRGANLSGDGKWSKALGFTTAP